MNQITSPSQNLSVVITLPDGTMHSYAQSSAARLDDYFGPNFVQQNFLARVLTLPNLTVFFRPDADGSRNEVVFELGKCDPVGDPSGAATRAVTRNMLGGYTVTIRNGVMVIATVVVPNHWWYSRWRWQSAKRPIVKTPAALIAAGLSPPFGAAPGSVPAMNYPQFVFTGPMSGAGVTQGMENTGERDDIGIVTEWAAAWLRDPSPANEAVMRDTAEASGSIPWNYRDWNTGAPVNLVQYPIASAYYDPNVQGQPSFPNPANLLRNAAGNPESGWYVDEDAHFPALSVTAFMATGDRYFLEQTQFEFIQAYLVTDYYDASPGVAAFPKGAALPHPLQTRSVAWPLRSLFHARKSAMVAESFGPLPADILPSSVMAEMSANAAKWFELWRTNPTPAGTVFHAATIIDTIQPWQESYLGATLGMAAVTYGFAEWLPAAQWKLQTAVDLGGGLSGWPPALPVVYWMGLGPRDASNNPIGGSYKPGDYPASAYCKSYGDAWATFENYYTVDPAHAQLTPSQYAALKIDPTNGGVPLGSPDYRAALYGNLVYAEVLKLVNATEALALQEGYLVKADYMCGRWALDPALVVSAAPVTAPVPLPPQPQPVPQPQPAPVPISTAPPSTAPPSTNLPPAPQPVPVAVPVPHPAPTPVPQPIPQPVPQPPVVLAPVSVVITPIQDGCTITITGINLKIGT